MGTPDFSVPVLEKLIDKHEVVAVYTRAPTESGRGKKVNKSPIHLLAESKGINVRTPKSLKSEDEQQWLSQLNADIAVVAAYGLLLPKAVLEMFPLGCINVHASILPRWRGAAPIQRVIEAGDDKSGISIMQMAEELDAGDVYLQEEISITPNMTGGMLHDTLSQMGADLLLRTLDSLTEISPTKQNDSLVTYAKKLDKSECLIDFSLSTEVLLRKIRAFNPYPSMYFVYENERFKIFEAESVDQHGNVGEILKSDGDLIIATSDGAIKVVKIQRQGKQIMSISELLRGFKFKIGEKL
jgi:methionyl-tRNA formyltransferase